MWKTLLFRALFEIEYYCEHFRHMNKMVRSIILDIYMKKYELIRIQYMYRSNKRLIVATSLHQSVSFLFLPLFGGIGIRLLIVGSVLI